MNFEDIQSTWNSGANRPTAGETAQLKTDLLRQLRGERLREALWLGWTCLLLSALTAHLLPWLLFQARLNFSTDWMLIPLLALPWGFTLVFLRRFFLRRKSLAAATGSIVDALRAAQAETRAAQFTLKGIAALQLAFAVLLPFLIWQLHATGKLAMRELYQMAFLFGGILLGGGAFVALKYFGALRPRQERVAALLRSYDQMS